MESLKTRGQYKGALWIHEKLKESGFRAYIVGGAIRDALLGRRISDLDLCTTAKPEEVLKIFPHTKPVGMEFGTVLVLGPKLESKDHFEVTTLRSDVGSKDGRRPNAVTFGTSIEEDAKRRDFTINALYYDFEKESVLDPVGSGIEDILVHKVIRAVGDPRKRFEEDHLRILRAHRFSFQLDMEIEPSTLLASRDLFPTLNRISKERVLVEIQKVMESPFPKLVDTCLFELPFHEIGLPLRKRRPEWKPPSGTWDQLSSLLRFFWCFETKCLEKSWPIDRELKRNLRKLELLRSAADPADAVLSLLRVSPELRAGILVLMRSEPSLFLLDPRQLEMLLVRISHLSKAFSADFWLGEGESLAKRLWGVPTDVLVQDFQECFPDRSLEGKEIGDILRRLDRAMVEGAISNPKEMKSWMKSSFKESS